MSVEIAIEHDNITQVASDLLLLKFAQSFYGADEAVANRLINAGVCTVSEISPAAGEYALVDTHGAIGAQRVLFLGTPRLNEFRYKEMRDFSRRAIEIIAQHNLPVRTLTTTVHGAGYGLDFEESLQSMVFGFQQGITLGNIESLQKIVFVELERRRFEVLQAAVQGVDLIRPAVPAVSTTLQPISQAVVPEPVRKQRVFVAMPFMEEFDDIYQFGIYAAVRRCGYVCEKVDESMFAGSIVERIVEGIRNAEFVIADLTHEKPNVYLEVGYAWGLERPVILVAREGQRLHFDLSHHKCIFYRTIGKLSESLEQTIRDLFPGTPPSHVL